MKTFTRALCVGLAALLPVAAAVAQDVKERSIKFAFQNQKGHPQAEGAQKFAELVAQKSGNKIQVKLFPGGTLGGDVQTVSALQGGTIEMTVLNAGILSSQVKAFAVYDLPFLFATPQEADAVVDGPFGKGLFDKLAEKNLIGLAYWELGFRNVTNSKRPINKVEDIAGLKIRVIQSPIYIDMFSALGANPVPLAFTELYTALEQKVVDGQENPVSVVAFAKFNEVQKHLSLTRHTYGAQSFMLSKRTWDKLSPDEQKVITDAAAETKIYQRRISRELNEKELESLKAKGMQVNDLAPQELARIREKLQPVVRSTLRSSASKW